MEDKDTCKCGNQAISFWESEPVCIDCSKIKEAEFNRWFNEVWTKLTYVPEPFCANCTYGHQEGWHAADYSTHNCCTLEHNCDSKKYCHSECKPKTWEYNMQVKTPSCDKFIVKGGKDK